MDELRPPPALGHLGRPGQVYNVSNSVGDVY